MAEQLAALRQVEAEGWRAWDESKKPKNSRTVSTGTGRRGTKISQSSTSQTDNAEFLNAVLDALDRQAKLCGLYQKPIATTEATILTGIPDNHVDRILREHYATE